MTRKKETRKNQTPQAMAQQAVEKYFAELTQGVPSDGTDVNLVDVAVAIESALVKTDRRYKNDRASAALKAGYLVGLEVGRRLAGGAR